MLEIELVIEGINLKVAYDYTSAQVGGFDCGPTGSRVYVDSVKLEGVEIMGLCSPDAIEEMESQIDTHEIEIKGMVA